MYMELDPIQKLSLEVFEFGRRGKEPEWEMRKTEARGGGPMVVWKDKSFFKKSKTREKKERAKEKEREKKKEAVELSVSRTARNWPMRNKARARNFSENVDRVYSLLFLWKKKEPDRNPSRPNEAALNSAHTVAMEEL